MGPDSVIRVSSSEVLNIAPVFDEEVTSDDETHRVDEDKERNEKVEIHKFRTPQERCRVMELFMFSKETAVTTHGRKGEGTGTKTLH